jgi:hypothetical protein
MTARFRNYSLESELAHSELRVYSLTLFVCATILGIL